MSTIGRVTTFCFLLLGLSAIAFGQANDPEAYAALATAGPRYDKAAPVDLSRFQNPQLALDSSIVFDATTGGIVGHSGTAGPVTIGQNVTLSISVASGSTDGLDTVPTFDGKFFPQAGPDSTGLRLFRFSTIGNHPLTGNTTVIPAQITEVSLTLLNADGTTFQTVSFAPFEDHTLQSPNFARANYASGFTLQYADAVQRAEFFHRMASGWHTVLHPSVVDHVTLTVPRFVNVQQPDGSIIQARSYFTGTTATGHTFVLMLDLLFNFFFDNVVVSEINSGNFQSKAMNMTLFPNTFLFSLNANNPNVPGGCCTLGLHTFFFSPGAVPQPRWLTEYASWISPGLFGGGFQDVTSLSHEISEAFNDPFGDNITPSWQFPGVPANAKICQNNLEVGDPVEILANATTTVTIGGFTYHPQNMALLQWFEMGATSNALNGAFSFPNKTVLPHSALPCPQ